MKLDGFKKFNAKVTGVPLPERKVYREVYKNIPGVNPQFSRSLVLCILNHASRLDVLMRAFHWRGTTSGHDYWLNLHDMYYNTFLHELPGELQEEVREKLQSLLESQDET